MSKIEEHLQDEQEQQDYEHMKFECWYWSVVDDVANLIVTNGYDQIMLDITKAVDRITESRVQ